MPVPFFTPLWSGENSKLRPRRHTIYTKQRSFLIGLAALAATALVVPVTPVAAQDTTDVYIVHGLNLDGQDAQTDGGTNVTVCANETELIADFEFGQIEKQVALPSGTAVKIEIYLGASVSCN